MRLKFDDKMIDATPRYIAAVEELLAAEAEMLGAALNEPETWAVGRASIGDLANCNSLGVEFAARGELDTAAPEPLNAEGRDFVVISLFDCSAGEVA